MKIYLFILLVSLSVFSINAQNDELNKLVNLVTTLRTGGETAYNKAVKVLAADKQWTPMNEVRADIAENECSNSDRVPGFKLRSIMNHAQNDNRYQSTTAGFLNGADIRYDYSLYERTIKPNRTVTLNLPERWGEQIIMIIPYDGDKSKLSATASGNEVFKQESTGNGCIKLTGRVNKGKQLSVKIHNGSDANRSYVIINYNSRK